MEKEKDEHRMIVRLKSTYRKAGKTVGDDKVLMLMCMENKLMGKRRDKGIKRDIQLIRM